MSIFDQNLFLCYNFTMFTVDTPKTNTDKPKTEKRRHPVLTKREMKLLYSENNLLEKGLVIDKIITQETISNLQKMITTPGLPYKLVSLRPNDHAHSIVLQKIGDRYKYFFVDDDSVNDREVFAVSGFIDINRGLEIERFTSPNEDGVNINEIITFIELVVIKNLERDINVVLNEEYLQNMNEVVKPKATKFVDPLGKNTKVWKKPRD